MYANKIELLHTHVIVSFTFLAYGRAGTTASWTYHRPSAMTRTATGGRPLRRWARNAVVWASAPTTGCYTYAAVSTARPAWAASNGMIRWPASGRLVPAWPPAAGTAASPSSVSLCHRCMTMSNISLEFYKDQKLLVEIEDCCLRLTHYKLLTICVCFLLQLLDNNKNRYNLHILVMHPARTHAFD